MSEDFVINDVLTDYGGTDKVVTIPESVRVIGCGAFLAGTALEEVILPESVERIESGAFCNCKALKRVELSGGLKRIGKEAFFGCTSLEQINLPCGLERIGKEAFEFCSALTEVRVPPSVTRIEKGAFAGCEELARVWLPERLKGKVKLSSVFKRCKKLFDGSFLSSIKPDAVVWYKFYIENDVLAGYSGTDNVVTVPDGVRVIGENVFSDDDLSVLPENRLKKVVLPEGVWKIGDAAFDACFFLEDVELPSSLEVIESFAFGMCAIRHIDLPSGLKEIGWHAFVRCSDLKQVTIPLSVEEIGEGAFCGCKNLTHVRVPVHLREQIIQNEVFSGCDALTEENIEWYSGAAKSELPVETRAEIPPETAPMLPETNTEAREERTDTVPDLTETRPEFEGQDRLNDIQNREREIGTNEEFVIENDVLVKYNGTDEEVIIPENVRVIGEEAFQQNALRKVVIPERVQEIERNAFLGCALLQEIELPSSLKKIGGSAFLGCFSLKRVRIPADLLEQVRKRHPFGACPKLKEENIEWYGGELKAESLPFVVEDGRLVKYNGSMLHWESLPIGTATVPAGVRVIGTEAFQSCCSERKIILPEGVEAIERYAFRECQMSQVELPDGLRVIGKGAFMDCPYLETVVVPSSVLMVGESAFAGCASLKQVRIPAILRAEAEAENVFRGCTELKDENIEWY